MQCDAGLRKVADDVYFPTAKDLEVVCTADCLTSLQALRAKQLDACTGNDVIDLDHVGLHPTLIYDLLISTYNYTCLKDE